MTTDNRRPSERLPATAAGRTFLAKPWGWSARFVIYPEEVRNAILAIEAEAANAARGAGLDVERLAEAIRNTYLAPSASRDMDAENIVREYNRLAAASAPTPAEPLTSGSHEPEGLDVERLAEAGGNVLDGRRIGSVRLYANTITPDDWRAIAAEYARLAAATAAPSEDGGLAEPAGVDALREALADWAADFDEGWGDRFASGDHDEGGFTQLDHGDEHDHKIFRLLRAYRLAEPAGVEK